MTSIRLLAFCRDIKNLRNHEPRPQPLGYAVLLISKYKLQLTLDLKNVLQWNRPMFYDNILQANGLLYAKYSFLWTHN